MLPGGVTCRLESGRLEESRSIIDSYATWYETSVLGCSLNGGSRCGRRTISMIGWIEVRPTGMVRLACSHDSDEPSVCSTRATARRICSAPAAITTRTHGLPRSTNGPVCSPQVSTTARRRRSNRSPISRSRRTCACLVRRPWRRTTSLGEPDRPEFNAEGDRYSFAKATRYKDRVVQLGPLSTWSSRAIRSSARSSSGRGRTLGYGNSPTSPAPSRCSGRCDARWRSWRRISASRPSSNRSRKRMRRDTASSMPRGEAGALGEGGAGGSPTTR